MPHQHQKRRLTKDELAELRELMEKAPQGKKPTVRQLSRHFGVNQPSILKSLDGWKGIQRGRPEKAPKPQLLTPDESPPIIQPFSTQVPEDLK